MSPGHVRGRGAFASCRGPARTHMQGILKLPSLMGTNRPAPPPPSVPSRMRFFQTEMTHRCESPAPHFPFLPK